MRTCNHYMDGVRHVKMVFLFACFFKDSKSKYMIDNNNSDATTSSFEQLTELEQLSEIVLDHLFQGVLLRMARRTINDNNGINDKNNASAVASTSAIEDTVDNYDSDNSNILIIINDDNHVVP